MRTVLELPKRIWDSFNREPHTQRARRRPLRMIDNLFLHLHPNRVSPASLCPGATLGLGLISASLFVILLLTGLLLMFYYVPSVPAAYERMQDLIYVVRFGRVVRDLHRVAAEGMVVSVFLHMLRVFYTGAYKTPREFNWLVGLALLTATLGLSFTGYLLPWDQLAYWAITVSAGILDYYPVISAPLRELVLGDRTVGQEALLRFYVLHVCLLPSIALALTAYHVWRIRKDGGLAAQEANPQSPITNLRSPIPAYPLLLWIEIAAFLAVLLVSLAVALAFPSPLGPLANADHPPNPAKAPWYFVALQELVSHSAMLGGVVTPIVLLGAGMLLPYLDRGTQGVGVWFARPRLRAMLLATALIVAWLGLTLVGAFMRGPNWNLYWPGQPWPGPG